MLHIFFRGMVIGLITGMPLGPIGAFCLKTTLTKGPLFGFAAGLGSCTADSIYASIAALGLTFISKFFVKHQHILRLLGGILLLIFGLYTIMSKKENKETVLNSKTIFKAFFESFILAFANPATILSFLFVFAAYGSKSIGHSMFSRIILVGGVFCGSILWWILLVLVAKRFHKGIDIKRLSVINKLMGSIIVFSGILFILSIFNYTRLRISYAHSKLFEIILHIKAHHFFH